MNPASTNNWRSSLGLGGGIILSACLACTVAFYGPKIAIATVAVLVGAAIAIKISPWYASCFFLCYLLLDGLIKMVANYNTVARVALDLVFIFASVTLLRRLYSLHTKIPIPLDVRKRLSRMLVFLFAYWGFVLVQFLNPWGLGFIPSLAGVKTHIIPGVMFLVFAYALKQRELEKVPFILFAICLIQAVWAIVEKSFLGLETMAMISPRYIQTYSNLYGPALGFTPSYRPYGTTVVPGGPSTWMPYGIFFTLICLHQLRNSKKLKPFIVLASLAIVAFLYVTMICQTRTAMMASILIAVSGFAMRGKKQFLVSLVIAPMILLGSISLLKTLAKVSTGQTRQQLKIVSHRFDTLTRLETYGEARSGPTMFVKRLARRTLMGIGLSRIGGPAGPFVPIAKREQYFGTDYSFADNLTVMLFAELGLGGAIAFYIFVLVLIVSCLKSNRYLMKLLACLTGVLFFGIGYASEGVLLQPNATLFHVGLAVVLRIADPGEESEVQRVT